MIDFAFLRGMISFFVFTLVASCKRDTSLVQFASSSASLNEFGKPQIITIVFSAPIHVDGILQVGIRDSTATYGSDYTTSPDGNSKTISIPVTKNATSASFTIQPVRPSSSDGDKVVNFTINGLLESMKLGRQKSLRVTVIDDDLVCYLPMNRNARDMSHFANNTQVRGATLTAGRNSLSNSAYQMNGIDNYIVVANSQALDTIQRITMTAWIKPVSFRAGNDAIVEKPYLSHINPYYQCKLGITGEWPNGPRSFLFCLSIGGNYVPIISHSGTWVPGYWYFIAGTYDGSKMILYVNGKEAISELVIPAHSKIDSWGRDIWLGGASNTKMYMPGTIGEIRIYNRALTAEEIKALYLR